MPTFRYHARPVAAAWTVLLVGCASSTDTGADERLPVRLVNDDSISTYLLAQTETPTTATLVAPGATRVIQLNYEPGNPLGAPFQAVRAGRVLAEVYCFARFTEGNLAPEVRWDGTRLACRAWGP